MSPIIISLILSALSLIGILYLSLFRFAKVESRVEILWGFLMRQGLNSALLGGLLEKNSPLRFNMSVLRRNEDFINRVRDWYDDPKLKKLKDLELFMLMEKHFNIELTELCIKERILPGGCLSALLFLLRPESFKEYDTADWSVPERRAHPRPPNSENLHNS